MTADYERTVEFTVEDVYELTVQGPALGTELQPFVGEDEFWRVASARIHTLRLLRRVEGILSTALTDVVRSPAGDDAEDTVGSTSLPATRIARAATVRGFLAKRAEQLELLLRGRRRVSGRVFPAPRVLRLADLLELDDAATDVLVYLVLVMSDAGVPAPSRRGTATELGEVAELFALSPQQFYFLASERHPLVRAEIIPFETRAIGGFRARELRLDPPVAKMLRGVPLAEEDGHVLGDGVLAEVLAQESATSDAALCRPCPSDEVSTESDGSIPSAPPDFDFDAFLREQSALELDPSEDVSESGEALRNEACPYTNDLDYLRDHIAWFEARRRWKKLQMDGDESRPSLGETVSLSAKLREAKATAWSRFAHIERRLEASRHALTATGAWLPRAERLASARGLAPFEKHVLLLAAGLRASPHFRWALLGKGSYKSDIEVGDLLLLFFDSLEDQIRARRHFYRAAPLLRDGLIDLSSLYTDVLKAEVVIDRRMTDFLVGLEAEASALTEGSYLYTPEVDIDRVVLPKADKELIVRTVSWFPAFQRERRRSGLDEYLTYGTGLTLLFYGQSGTGKTMMANAIATHLGKRLLLINFPKLESGALKFVFREAKINDAVLFFDECESIFEHRDKNPATGPLLSEIERHDGLVILATNRPLDLDEAMHRRITLAVEFHPPDTAQREQIWRAHIPREMRLEGEPDFASLAYDFELSGGMIKNAVLAALAIATARLPDQPVVRPDDLAEGARRQLAGRLRLSNLSDRVVPSRGLSSLVLPPDAATAVRDLIGLEKARRTLTTQWGFGVETGSIGATALFFGVPGTGKSLAAEAVAYELGRTMKRVNVAQVISKWVGEGARNIGEVFLDARESDAVLLFDEADVLFGGRTAVQSSTDRYANLDVAVLLREMERYPGVVILTSNLVENIDEAFRRRLRIVVEFPRPSRPEREKLWELHIPQEMPQSADVSITALARDFELTGANIRNAILKAAVRAALRREETRCVRHTDFEAASKEEQTTSAPRRHLGFVTNS